MSAEFKALSETDRANWDQLAAEDSERYHREMESYVPPKEDKKQDGQLKTEGEDDSDEEKEKKMPVKRVRRKPPKGIEEGAEPPAKKVKVSLSMY